ncbi:MAG: hypothetical protein A2Y51_00480 [Gallionellales bacterium RIFCSPLOWO2_02_60_31]|nr:MAG: hypothetical protein A2Y51_00480 [Gallionellales bacterium RIFCSPLOWO2_02_60_31]
MRRGGGYRNQDMRRLALLRCTKITLMLVVMLACILRFHLDLGQQIIHRKLYILDFGLFLNLKLFLILLVIFFQRGLVHFRLRHEGLK